MKERVLGPLCAVFVMVSLFSAPASAATDRILLVGDSWARESWTQRVFETALGNKGLGQFSELGEVTSIGGTTAAQWATPGFLALITQELQANPTLDIIHLSVGGNDFLNAGPTTIDELLGVIAQVADDVDTIVDHVHGVRSNVRVALGVYDYVNLSTGFSFELGIFAEEMIARAALKPNLFLLNNLGVLHHRFGFPNEFGPGETPLPGGFPDYLPLRGGDPDFPGNPNLFVDEIHPTEQGYVALAEHAIDAFYAQWLLPPVAVPVLPGFVTWLFCGSLAGAGFGLLLRRRIGRAPAS